MAENGLENMEGMRKLQCCSALVVEKNALCIRVGVPLRSISRTEFPGILAAAHAHGPFLGLVTIAYRKTKLNTATLTIQ